MGETMENNLKELVCNTIDKNKEKLHKLSQDIWSHPELAYEEVYAHNLLTSFLQEEGFKTENKPSLPTSFVLSYGETGGLHVGLVCEYDALPNIGHACGHNLIAEVGLASALGLKAIIETNPVLKIKVSIFGTPAEERGGGKIQMLQDGCFDDVDMVLMSHPMRYEIPRPTYLAKCEFNVKFRGKPSHAAAAPWEGINALDASVACYNSVSMLRQQMKPTSRVHCVITNGGSKPNIIPELSEMSFFVRGFTNEDMTDLKEKVQNCVRGAAKQTGCEVDITEVGLDYHSLKTNEEIIKLYISNAKQLGVEFNDDHIVSFASTDMGNISQAKPSIHPKFKIKASCPNHSHEFTKAAGLLENQEFALKSAKSMAMSVVDLLLSKELINKIKEDFQKK